MSDMPDKRYRILVLLRRADRPKYWDFHCPYCKTKVVELAGDELYAIDDAVDTGRKGTKGFLCPGAHRIGCDKWYYFEDKV